MQLIKMRYIVKFIGYELLHAYHELGGPILDGDHTCIIEYDLSISWAILYTYIC